MSSKTASKGFMRPKQAWEYLDIPPSTFWLYVKQGKIRTKKLSARVTLISIEELEKFAGLDSEA